MKLSYRTTNGSAQLVLPDSAAIPVPAIRKAVSRAEEMHALYTDATKRAARARDEKKRTVERIEQAARAAAIRGDAIDGDKDTADLRAVDDALAAAVRESRARGEAYEDAYRGVLDAIDQHRAAWYAKAAAETERGLALLTGARQKLREAEAVVTAGASVVAMLDRYPHARVPVIQSTAVNGYLGGAQAALTDAIGAAAAVIEKRSIADKAAKAEAEAEAEKVDHGAAAREIKARRSLRGKEPIQIEIEEESEDE